MRKKIEAEAPPATSLPPAARLLLRGLDRGWERYCASCPTGRQGLSAEALHALRVSTRRLATLLKVLAVACASKKARALQQELKEQLSQFDALSDLQAQMAYLAATADVAGAAEFTEHLCRRETKLLRQMARRALSVPLKKQQAQFEKIRRAAAARLQTADVRARLLAEVDDAYARVLRRQARIDPADTATIHCTRLAFKSFRYAVEVLHPLLARYPVEQLKAMNKFQKQMGDIQDAEVLQATLAAFQKTHPGVEVTALQAQISETHTARIQLFLSNLNDLKTFWRATPRQPYPWNRRTPTPPASETPMEAPSLPIASEPPALENNPG